MIFNVWKSQWPHFVLGVLAALGVGRAVAQDLEIPVSPPQVSVRAAEVLSYWTPERMASAVPMDLMNVPSSAIAVSRADAVSTGAAPGALPGWNPQSGLAQPTWSDAIEFESPDQSVSSQSFGSAPSNPVDYDNYGKYQRWTWYGRYLTYPTSVIGKMFFSQGGGSYVCSGTVVGRNIVATAGHCVSDGAGNWSTNILFCPSYNNVTGVNSSRGCWSWTGYASTPSDYHTASDTDRDYACFVTQSTGTVVSDNIGDVTGWAGLAYNWSNDQMVLATGYPAGSPFVGNVIIFAAAVEWYSVNMDSSDSNVSKYIGSDMTGGSSGGGWLLNLDHAQSGVRVADVDSSNVTDPGQNNGTPYWNGLNSHKRCMTNCNTPPTSTNGVFWSEMGSPEITNSDSDNRDFVDVYNDCYNNGGS